MNSQYIKEENSTVTFQIQNGPIKEVGVNGCQIDDVIQWALNKIQGFNKNLPCRENSIIITKLEEALLWSMKRKWTEKSAKSKARLINSSPSPHCGQ